MNNEDYKARRLAAATKLAARGCLPHVFKIVRTIAFREARANSAHSSMLIVKNMLATFRHRQQYDFEIAARIEKANYYNLHKGQPLPSPRGELIVFLRGELEKCPAAARWGIADQVEALLTMGGNESAFAEARGIYRELLAYGFNVGAILIITRKAERMVKSLNRVPA